MVPDAGGAEASLREMLAAALEANRQLSELAERLRAENERLRAQNARLRERDVRREAELERVSAELAVLQRLVFGRSSERPGRSRSPAAVTSGYGRRRGPRVPGRGGGRVAGPAQGLLASAAGGGDLGFR